jgi:hypothetical protein
MYTINEHRHRFAIWTASAASRQGIKIKGYKNELVKKAIDTITININAQEVTMRDITSNTIIQNKFCMNFDEYFTNVCNKYIESINGNYELETDISFGKAAKAVSVYFKTMIVCGGNAESTFGEKLYPPIDRVLIESIWKNKQEFFYGNEDLINRFKYASRNNDKVKSWSQLSQDEYQELVKILKEANNSGPLWKIEEYWSL